MPCLNRDGCPVVVNTRDQIARYKEKLAGLQTCLGHLSLHYSTEGVHMMPLRLIDRFANEDDEYYFTAKQLDREIARTNLYISRGSALLTRLDEQCGSGPLTMQAPKVETMHRVTLCTGSGLPDQPGEPANIVRTPIV